MKNRSLKSQFNHVICECSAIGESKHAALPQEIEYKAYSVKSLERLRDTANQFAPFLREHFPEVRWLRDIGGEHVAAWLESKKEGWSGTTFAEMVSRMNKLERMCHHMYNCCRSGWTSVKVEPPDGPPKVRDAMMSRQDYNQITASFKASRSFAPQVMEVTQATGHRVEEATLLRGRDIDTVNWTVHVPRKAAKNGRARTMPIREKDRAFYTRLKARGESFVFRQKNGRLYQPGSANDAIRRHMKQLGIADKYPKSTVHAIRKMYATERMRELRGPSPLDDHKAERKAWSVVSQELGHGANRPDLYDTYVRG